MENQNCLNHKVECPYENPCHKCQQSGPEEGYDNEPWEYQQFIDADKIPVVKNYPYTLQQACMDRFRYLAFLAAGAVVEFEAAVPISDKWVHLDHCFYSVPGDEAPARAERGLDVNIDNIVLVVVSPCARY
ncbi:MAG: hypothetical protein U5L07_04690 [Desulfobacterales bacterium]|nr:hypothetical protein [Desulfobacterales bacterium]